jgi:hypothetical protein
MKNFARASLLAVIAWTFAGSVSANTLTIADGFGVSTTTWTLNVGSPCTLDCVVTLSAFFEDPDGAGALVNAYTGTYIDSVHWVINSPNVDLTNAGFNGTTAGTVADWTFTLNTSPNANQCGAGGPQGGTCGAWVDGAVGAGGFGPIVNGSTLTWSFLADFASALPTTLVAGNIRAGFNTSTGSNFNIFSPGGSNFDTPPDSPDNPIENPVDITPEPATLLLFGSGLTVVAARLRQRRQRKA